jgi:hypothetical protein
MIENTGIMLVLAYPETIVMVAKEWYSPYLKYLGVGKKDYLRAGHAALVLINKKKGNLEYHDFGRYITSEPNGRVRGVRFDRELEFPLKANIVDGDIENLNDILFFLSTNPKITHGEGKLVVSVCKNINYKKAKTHISDMQSMGMIRYAAFVQNASNCARFVTSTLIASVTDLMIKKHLIKSQLFTPSTVGNVVIADTESQVYEVSDTGEISRFTSSVGRENIKYFLDRLPNHTPNYVGTLKAKPISGIHVNAQWLSGIAAGAWFELTKHSSLSTNEFRFRRISSHGNVDVDAVFYSEADVSLSRKFQIRHYSNCLFCEVQQDNKIFKLLYLRDF